MSLAGFENLREVERLLKQEKEHLETIKAHQLRIDSLSSKIKNQEELVTEKNEQIKELNSQIQKLENSLEKADSQLEKTKKAEQDAVTTQQSESAQKQKESLQQQVDEFQEKILELMEQVEDNQSQRAEAQTFLDGVAQTRLEIEKEVEKDKALENEKLAQIKERIHNLFSITPAFLVEAFKRSCEKHRFNHPLTYLHERRCFYCRYTPESSLFGSLERADEAFFCQGCRRLFAPTTRGT